MVSKQAKDRIVLKVAEKAFELQIENFQLKRLKTLDKLEVRIFISCLKFWKTYKDIVGMFPEENYDYVKKVMDGMAIKGILKSVPTFEDGKPTNRFITDISDALKEYDIRFPNADRNLTESKIRNLLYERACDFAKRVKHGQ